MGLPELDTSLSRTGSVRLPIYYGWISVFLAALAMTATFPGRTIGLGLINGPLQKELGIGDVFHGTLNFWSVVLGAALCLPAGRLLDRLGSRIVLTTTAAALGIVVLLMSRVMEPTGLFITLTLTRALGQGALSVVSIALVGKWFRRRLAVAMGLYAVLLTFGFIAVTLGLTAAIDAYGWRSAWAGIGWTLLLGMAPLAALLTRSTPEESHFYDAAEFPLPADETRTPVGATLRDALVSAAFWVFTLSAALFNMIFSAFTFFVEGVLRDQGLAGDAKGQVLAALTFSGLIANLLAGWLSPKWPPGRLLAAGMILLAAALGVFPAIRDGGSVLAFALLLGAAGGIVTVVFFAVYGRLFGRAHLGHIQGAAQVLAVLASALGPFLLAVSRERIGHAFLFLATAVGAGILGIACWIVPVPESRG